MSRPRRLVRTALHLIAFSMFSLTVGQVAAAQTRPNILYVFADDVGWGDIKSNNPQAQVSLPSIEQLAAQGLRFTDAHVSAAKCAPARYNAISGNYHWRGRKNWGQWQYVGGSQILPGQETIGNMLQQAGYNTAFVGKHHLGAEFRLTNSNNFANSSSLETDIDFSRPLEDGPIDHGFDYSFMALRGIQRSPYAFFENNMLFGDPNSLIIWPSGDFGDTSMGLSGIGVPDWNTREVGPTLLEKAVEFIDDHHNSNITSGTNQPFFIYYNTQAVHSPLKPPIDIRGTPILGSTGVSDRTDLLREIDEVLSVLQVELTARRLLENTLIVFTSDNGGLRFGTEVRVGHDTSGGFRGYKGMIFEGGHRVPLILKWGDGTESGSVIQPGSVSDVLIGVQDLYATFAALVGIQVPDDQARDSFNMLPVLQGQFDNAIRDHMIHEADVNEARDKIPRHFALREGDWKLIPASTDVPLQLYNLAIDPAETTNLRNDPANSFRVEQMRDRLAQLRLAERTTPPSGTPGNSVAQVSISSPGNGDQFDQGAQIVLAATAIDSEDGDIGASIVWTSDLQGQTAIGTGSPVTVSSLQAGAHLITASVTDSGGARGSASVTITVVDAGSGNSITLANIGDAHTRDLSGFDTKNYGRVPRLRVDPYGDRSAYMRFDVSGLPAQVTSAMLTLNVEEVGVPGTFNIIRVIEDWDEATITASNEPDIETTPLTSFSVRATDVGGVVQVDITGLVADWLSDPSSAYGLVISRVGNAAVSFRSKESGSGPVVEVIPNETGNSLPEVNITSPLNNSSHATDDVISLIATANDAEDGDVTDSIDWNSSLDGFLGSTGSIEAGLLNVGTHIITASVTDSGGATGSANVTITVVDAGGGNSITLANIGDAHTRDKSGFEAKNYGRVARLRVDPYGDRSSYMRFDVSGLPAQINSATLSLVVEEVGVPGTFNVFRIIEGWDEMTITASNEPASEATLLASFPVQASDVGGVVQVDITSLVAGWQADPSSAYGLVISRVGNAAVSFRSKESGNGPIVEVIGN